MAHNSILIIFLIFLCTSASTANFIQQQCQETLYFQLCVSSLSRYINSTSTSTTPAKIANIALRISLVKARSTRAYINQVANQLIIINTASASASASAARREYQSVKDCLAQITDGVDEIAHSVAEFGRLMNVKNVASREKEFSWHESNVVTWLSTASTDVMACMNGEGFPWPAAAAAGNNAIGRKTKRIIRAKVLNVAQLNSNALALVNTFVKRRHRPAASASASANNSNYNSNSSINKP